MSVSLYAFLFAIGSVLYVYWALALALGLLSAAAFVVLSGCWDRVNAR